MLDSTDLRQNTIARSSNRCATYVVSPAVAETANAPLPPPPLAGAPPPQEDRPKGVDAIKEHDFAFNTDGYKIEDGNEDITDEESMPGTEQEWEGADEGEDVDMGRSSESKESSENRNNSQKRGNKIAEILKKTAKAGVSGALSVDHLKAKIGSEPAKRRLGIIPHEAA